MSLINYGVVIIFMILSWLGGSRNSLKKGRNEDSLLYRLVIHKITVWALYTKLGRVRTSGAHLHHELFVRI